MEGLGSQAAGFSAVQEAIADGEGSQCGFCTPGWVAAMSALLARRGHPSNDSLLTPKMIEEALDGNLCRCTGYRPILEAFKQRFGEDGAEISASSIYGARAPAGAPAVPDASDCCRHRLDPADPVDPGQQHATECDIEESASACHDVRTRTACARECDAIAKRCAQATAAPAIARARASAGRPLRYSDPISRVEYIRPTTLAALQCILQSNPEAILVGAKLSAVTVTGPVCKGVTV